MRSYNRFSTDEEIEVVVAGEKDIATLYNLSCGGCMFETRNPALREGDCIEVNLRGTVSAQGHVVWRVDNKAGIKFATPVHHRIVEMLGFPGEDEGLGSDVPCDRFGLPLVGKVVRHFSAAAREG